MMEKEEGGNGGAGQAGCLPWRSVDAAGAPVRRDAVDMYTRRTRAMSTAPLEWRAAGGRRCPKGILAARGMYQSRLVFLGPVARGVPVAGCCYNMLQRATSTPVVATCSSSHGSSEIRFDRRNGRREKGTKLVTRDAASNVLLARMRPSLLLPAEPRSSAPKQFHRYHCRHHHRRYLAARASAQVRCSFVVKKLITRMPCVRACVRA
eukprot:GHVU01097339.1.p1 GENE.GHVU01097339.1~~GHVU01097339.1.p1  ORF type:complete len:207 (+),score=5.68 GHVU01097339.1:1008-1628(+)